MTTPRADTVICGQVVTAAEPDGLVTVESIGVAGGRIVSAGTRREVTDAAARGARVLDFRPQAVIPGLHDFHVHLPALARHHELAGLFLTPWLERRLALRLVRELPQLRAQIRMARHTTERGQPPLGHQNRQLGQHVLRRDVNRAPPAPGRIRLGGNNRDRS